MNILTSVLLLLLLSVLYFSRTEGITLQAKKLIRGKVLANGSSLYAKSLSQCIEHCNKREDICDGFVYHEMIGKCRLVGKCAPAVQVDNSSNVVYYSKRPQIKSRGYVHDPKTDNCLGLVLSEVDYPSAKAICAKDNAKLAVLNKKSLNDLGRDLISNTTSDWAWISDENVAYEEGSKPHGISGNDVLSEVFSPEVVQWRNESTRNCWGLNKYGEWGQFSCKNSTMFVLCQVPLFNV